MIIEDPVSYLFGTPGIFAVFLKDINGKTSLEFHVDTNPGLLIEIPLNEVQIIDHGDNIGLEFSGCKFSTTLRVSGQKKRRFMRFLNAEYGYEFP